MKETIGLTQKSNFLTPFTLIQRQITQSKGNNKFMNKDYVAACIENPDEDCSKFVYVNQAIVAYIVEPFDPITNTSSKVFFMTTTEKLLPEFIFKKFGPAKIADIMEKMRDFIKGYSQETLDTCI